MKTPKQKALELVEQFMNIRPIKMSDYSMIYSPTAKQCALLAVDEILSEFDDFDSVCNPKDEDAYNFVKSTINEFIQYWNEVKQEIEKL